MHNYDRAIIRRLISFIIKFTDKYPRRYYYSQSMIGKITDYKADCFVQPILHDTDFVVEDQGDKVILNMVSDNMQIDESWIHVRDKAYWSDYPSIKKEIHKYPYRLEKLENGSTKVPLLEFDSVTRKVKVWYHNFLQDSGSKSVYIRLGDDCRLIDEIESIEDKLMENYYGSGNGSNTIADTLNQVIEDGLVIRFKKA